MKFCKMCMIYIKVFLFKPSIYIVKQLTLISTQHLTQESQTTSYCINILLNYTHKRLPLTAHSFVSH